MDVKYRVVVNIQGVDTLDKFKKYFCVLFIFKFTHIQTLLYTLYFYVYDEKKRGERKRRRDIK